MGLDHDALCVDDRSMAEVFCSDVCLWVRDVGCRETRVALLALEPESRVWLEVEGEPILFERMRDGSDGRSTRGFKPAGEAGKRWLKRYREERGALIEFEFIERPLDEDKAGSGYWRLDEEITEADIRATLDLTNNARANR